MNWLDIVLIVVIGYASYSGYRNGVIRELVTIASVILAIPIAGVLYDDMFPKVEPIVDNHDLAALLSFVFILAGVIIAGQVAAHLLKRTAEILNLGVLDRLSGGAFGAGKAVIIAQAILIALIAFPKPDLRHQIDDSFVATELVDTAPAVLAFLPGAFNDSIDLFNQHSDDVAGQFAGESSTP